jgi:hypothetical protein
MFYPLASAFDRSGWNNRPTFRCAGKAPIKNLTKLQGMQKNVMPIEEMDRFYTERMYTL